MCCWTHTLNQPSAQPIAPTIHTLSLPLTHTHTLTAHYACTHTRTRTHSSSHSHRHTHSSSLTHTHSTHLAPHPLRFGKNLPPGVREMNDTSIPPAVLQTPEQVAFIMHVSLGCWGWCGGGFHHACQHALLGCWGWDGEHGVLRSSILQAGPCLQAAPSMQRQCTARAAVAATVAAPRALSASGSVQRARAPPSAGRHACGCVSLQAHTTCEVCFGL